jgi:lipopolysaccharide export system protein LptA
MTANRYTRLLIPCLTFTCMIFPAVPSLAQKVTKLEIMNAEVTAYDIKIGKDARKLIGDVRIKHEDVNMSCDSAYFYSSTGSVDAFSNVLVEQGDTLTLTGDKAHYDGETRIARMRHNVVLINNDITLLTDSLDYFRADGVATYQGGGILTQEEKRLTSGRGRFLLDTEVFYFMDSVVITSPEYNIKTDSLKYDTDTEISYFNGPTEITTDERYIYCENGWYDTRQDIAFVTHRAYLEEEGRELRGDTLYYEGEKEYGEAYSNVELIDTTQNMILRGNYGFYESDQETAMITDSALMIQVDGPDTMYVHADTLRSVMVTDTVAGFAAGSGTVAHDTLTAKSKATEIREGRVLKAYYHVKIFRSDLQAMCDSLVYVERDSAFDFFGDPVLWSEENQLAASHIKVIMENQQLQRMYLTGVALVVSQKDSAKFDQMRGKEMTGYFRNNKLDRIKVSGNGETLYYAVDQQQIIGANKTKCSDLMIYLKDNQISRVNYMVKPDGTYYPLQLLPDTETKLSDFKWVPQWRPLEWQDVFFWKGEMESGEGEMRIGK